MKPYNDVELNVLSKIKPSREEYEKGYRVYRIVKDRVLEVLEKHGVEGEPSLQGSFAKDTWLSGELDLDIFVLYPEEYGVGWVKTKGFQLLVEAVKDYEYIIKYAEHPYVHLVVDNVEVDLVPALKIKDPSRIRTAVDRTPFHTEYVLKHLHPSLRDDVRLLKKFLKGVGVYGAEIRVEGFSGYLCELLVIAYGGFRKVLEAAVKWRIPQVILVEPSIEVDKKLLRTRFKGQPLIVPDPVDPKRNVAAAVSVKSMATFMYASRLYISKPSINFFYPPKPSLKFDEAVRILDSRETSVLGIVFDINELNISPDILWGELKRIARRIVNLAKQFKFKIVDYGLWSDEERIALIVVEVEGKRLPLYELHEGPPIVVSNVDEFTNKYIGSREVFGPWINDSGRLVVLRKRRYTDLYSLISDRLQDIVITPNLSKCKYRVAEINDIIDLANKSEGLREWLITFIVKKPTWMP